MGKRRGHLVVTGAAGFLGGSAVSALADAGYEVTAVDDLSAGDPRAAREADLFVRMDVRDRSALYALLSNKATDAVIHLAGRHAPREVLRAPEQAAEINLGGTASLLGAMRPSNVRYMLLGSSLDVYGASPSGLSASLRPTTAYGRQMAAVEDLVGDCRQSWDLRVCRLRLGELGGSGVRSRKHGRLMDRLAYAARRPTGRTAFELQGRPAEAAAPGAAEGFEPRRIDLLHATDAAAAIVLAVEALLRDRAPGVMDVGRGVAVAEDELVKEARALSDRDFVVERVGLPEGEPIERVAARAPLSELGWTPRVTDPIAILRDTLSAG